MIALKISTMLNNQITKELFSSYLYLAISNYYADKNLDGFQNWFEVQTKEECDHAMLMRKYMLNNGNFVKLENISAPEIKFLKLNDGLIAALEHEKMITSSINDIYAQAFSEKDFKTTQFLDWFVKEQGEEEQNVNNLIKKFELFANDAKGLYLLNAELLTRVYAPPTLII